MAKTLAEAITTASLEPTYCPTCGVTVARTQIGNPWCVQHWERGPYEAKLFDPATGLPWYPCAHCEGPMPSNYDYLCELCRALR